jgi:hypothetical protein
MNKIKTGSGRQLRYDSLHETVLPVPYDAAAMPGATVLGVDGELYSSLKLGTAYVWRRQLFGLGTGEIIVGMQGPRDDFLISLNTGSPVSFVPALQIEGISDPRSTLTVTRAQNSNDAVSRLILAKTRASAVLGNSIVVNGDNIATILFSGDDGTAMMGGAAISTEVQGTPSIGDVPMMLILRTRAQGSGSIGITGRLRITSGGNVLINNTTGTERLSVTGNIQVTDESNGFRVGSNQVLGARRTGWTAPTGTAERTAYATYTAPIIANPPTQAEVQALSNHVQILSRRLKAVIDDQIAHGAFGA